jgi:hypothetical protein
MSILTHGYLLVILLWSSYVDSYLLCKSWLDDGYNWDFTLPEFLVPPSWSFAWVLLEACRPCQLGSVRSSFLCLSIFFAGQFPCCQSTDQIRVPSHEPARRPICAFECRTHFSGSIPQLDPPAEFWLESFIVRCSPPVFDPTGPHARINFPTAASCSWVSTLLISLTRVWPSFWLRIKSAGCFSILQSVDHPRWGLRCSPHSSSREPRAPGISVSLVTLSGFVASLLADRALRASLVFASKAVLKSCAGVPGPECLVSNPLF